MPTRLHAYTTPTPTPTKLTKRAHIHTCACARTHDNITWLNCVFLSLYVCNLFVCLFVYSACLFVKRLSSILQTGAPATMSNSIDSDAFCVTFHMLLLIYNLCHLVFWLRVFMCVCQNSSSANLHLFSVLDINKSIGGVAVENKIQFIVFASWPFSPLMLWYWIWWCTWYD